MRRARQLVLPLPPPRARAKTWGGARAGAGRKPKGPRAGTPHRTRPEHYRGHPVHVTLRSALRQLRSQLVFPTIQLAIARADRRAPERFRVLHFSVQSDHLHLIVEAASKPALRAGVSGLAVRVARYVNELLMRRGRFWADRWHGRALRSPREVRTAAVYVLANFRKHARRPLPGGIDPYSSGAWFRHFRGYDPDTDAPRFASRAPPLGQAAVGTPVSEARTWLFTRGLVRTAPIALDEAPGRARP